MNNQQLTQKWLNSANGKICYFASQKFAGRPTLVFLHGLSSNHTTWLAAIPTLEKFKLNFLMPDLRGHGYSDMAKKRDRYRFPVFSHDLKEIIEQEKLSKVILVGYSFGGYIALDYSAKHPDSTASLVLISANHVTPYQYGHIKFFAMPSYYILNFLAWLLLWQKRKQYYYFNQQNSTGYWESSFTGFTTMPISINFWMLSEVIGHLDFRKDIDKIICPTLIVRSQSDPFLFAREAIDMARQIKDAKVETIIAASHYLASEHQDKVVDVLINFLKEKRLI